MRTLDELERLWRASGPPPRGRGTVRLICVRAAGGHVCPARVVVTEERGVEGDRWYDNPARDLRKQVTLMSVRVAELIADEVPLDAAGDNLLVDLEVAEEVLPAGTRVRIGSALLAVSTAPHTGCKKFLQRFGEGALAWVNGRRELRLRGVNCTVIENGEVAVDDVVEVLG